MRITTNMKHMSIQILECKHTKFSGLPSIKMYINENAHQYSNTVNGIGLEWTNPPSINSDKVINRTMRNKGRSDFLYGFQFRFKHKKIGVCLLPT